MKRNYYYIIMLFLYSHDALASWLNGGSVETGTMGWVLNNFTEQISSIDGLLSVICFVVALCFGIAGVVKIRDHLEQPSKVTIREPLMRLLAAAFFVSLPTIVIVIIDSTIGREGNLNLKVDIDKL